MERPSLKLALCASLRKYSGRGHRARCPGAPPGGWLGISGCLLQESVRVFHGGAESRRMGRGCQAANSEKGIPAERTAYANAQRENSHCHPCWPGWMRMGPMPKGGWSGRRERPTWKDKRTFPGSQHLAEAHLCSLQCLSL